MNNSIDDFSEDVQEILSAPPSGLMIWGTAGIVGALFLMVFTGWMYKFPEKVVEDFYLTTEKEPLIVPAPFKTKVAAYFVKEGQRVIEGDELLYLEDGAKVDHVDSVKNGVNQILRGTIEFTDYDIPQNLQLGEVFPSFNAFTTKLRNYYNVISTIEDKANIGEYDELLEEVKKNISSIETKIEQANFELKELDKTWKEKTLELAKADSSKKTIWQQIVDNANTSRKEKRQEIATLKKYLSDAHDRAKDVITRDLTFGFDAKSDEAKSVEELMQSLNQLERDIFDWKEKHIIKAPISGKVTFYGVPEDGGYFVYNQQILSIIPAQDEGKYIAHVKLPVQKLSKVEEGDSVLLKFNRYPFLEFGGARGLINEKLPSNNPDFYSIKIGLRDGLKTTLNQNLDFQHQMTGKAEIIVADKRFISRLLEDFIAIFK